ncbi:MAG: putative peptidoglycan glycosyltransferase FtsW [Candidatus Marinimicrobia bacterium]|nr:putative peptidoglycan glycosyltransferase FtsW [Candidatus Neomarinimicrobiota bacterium]
MSSEKYDRPLLIITMILLAIGTVMVFSSSSDISLDKFGSGTFYFRRHLLRVFVGLAVMVAAIFIDYRLLKRIAAPLFIASIVLLIATKVIFLIAGNDSPARWLYLGPLRIQTSDLARFATIIYLATYIDKKRDGIGDYVNGFLPPVIMTGIVMALIIIQPDYSTAVMIGLIATTMLFIGRAKLTHMLATGAVGMTILIPVMIAEPYRLYRITSFIRGIFDFSGANYQLQQSIISLGNGGMMGVGLGASIGKNLFLPAPHTDFILAIVGEEIGFGGIFVLITLYLAVFHRALRITKGCTDLFGIMLGIGLSVQIVSYAFINAAVVTGIVPTTGLPIPFISFGGSGLLMNLLSVGILLNISMAKRTVSRRSEARIRFA